MLTIRATDVGFHILSPLNEPLAPNVFLRNFVNEKGTIVLDLEDGQWISEESLDYAEFRIVLNVPDTAAAADGDISEVRVTGITYERMIDGQMQQIGSLDLDDSVALPTYLDNPKGGSIDTHYADFGDVLEDALQADGFKFVGGAGDDVFNPTFSVLPIYGRVVVLGRDGNDQLYGGRTNDELRGGRGDDLLVDEGGTNILRGGRGDDEIRLGVWSQNSVGRGGSGDDLLTSSNGNDKLLGGAGQDTLLGHRGNDILAGHRGNDRLDGGEGNDTLRGGPGDDTLTGGVGADRFIFRANQEGHDRITDFEDGSDLIVLRAFDGGFDALALADTDAGTLITWDGADRSVLVENISVDQLGIDNFQF